MGTRRMDINSLLSPSESNGSASAAPPSSLPAAPSSSFDNPQSSKPAPAAERPIKATRAKGKSLIQQATASPRNIVRNISHPILPADALLHNQSVTSSPLASNAAHQQSSLRSAPVTPLQPPVGSPLLVGSVTPTSQPYPHPQRIPSTERMDFLADVAIQQQPSQQNNHNNNIAGFRGSISHDLPGNPSVPSSPSTARKSSLISSTGEILPAPTVQPRYNMSAASLSMPDIQTIVGLLKELQEDSYNSDKHVNLIALLRRGLNAHIDPEDGAGPANDPTSYELTGELRQAREAMDARFPLGEDRWIEWIQDECMLARTTDERARVLDLCKKAVDEEAGSSRLWRLYGDWVTILYQKSHGINDLYPNNLLEQHPLVGPVLARRDFTEDEKAVGLERFSREVMLTVWAQGVMATEWHINDSNLVWDPYISILINQMPLKPPMSHVQSMQEFFTDRLKQPHKTSDQTFAMFNEFVSKYASDSYEARMVAATELHSAAKHQLGLRQESEFHLMQAIDSGDAESEWQVWSNYLDLESRIQKRKNQPPYALKLYLALYERVNLRFPSSAELWEEHYGIIRERRNELKAASTDVSKEVLAVTKRAVRHCPWSGSLWALRLFALESHEKDFESIAEEKHQATSKGLLENVGGMDELIKAYSAWCGFLRRRAFAPGAGEDEQDVAEVGIRSAIESVRTVGESKYGKEFRGDPLFRIERIYHKFLSQSQRLDEARQSWSKLAEVHGNQIAFWERYYLWEMTTWGKETGTQAATTKNWPPPEIATAVLQKAICQPQLDWPEKAIEMYLHHCAQHENIEKIQDAHVECDKIMKDVTRRRKQEAEEAAAAQAQAHEDATNQAKRKREQGSPMSHDNSNKRVRSTEEEDEEMQSAHDSASIAPEAKRNREGAMVIVHNLAPGTTEKRVRQFFRDCGEILSVSIIETPEEGNDTLTASLEFETHEDLLAAITKNNKTLDGHQIQVADGSSTSVFVSNYPPDWGKEEIVDLFKTCGEIVEVRFPSLKHGVTRRFCYVQYVTYDEAKAAEVALDNRVNGKYNLNVKVSAPQDKKSREGAQEEGREVFVVNLPFDAYPSEVRRHFAKVGKVRNVRMKKGLDGKSQGRAWVIYDKAEEAEAAVRDLHDSRFQGRNLNVTSSKHRAPKRVLISHVGDDTNASSLSQPMDTSGSPARSEANSEPFLGQGPPRLRTIIVRNIPDTVHHEQVEKKLAPFGTFIKSVRRVTKNDHIIEFSDPASASAARLALDGSTMWETTVRVTMANEADGESKGPAMVPTAVKVPRPRVGKQSALAKAQRTFHNAPNTEASAAAEGSGSKSDSHANGNAGTAEGNGEKAANDSNQPTETDKPAETKPAKMSNADFRAFLG